MRTLHWYAISALLTRAGITLMTAGAHDNGLLLLAGLVTAALTRILRSHQRYNPPGRRPIPSRR